MCFYIFFVCFVGCHLIHIKCFVMTTSFWFQNISSLQSKTLYTVSSFSPLPHIHRPWQPPVSLMDLCPSSTSSIPPHPSHLTINRFSVLMSKFVLFVFFFLESTYKWNHMVFVFLWIISLSIPSMSIYGTTNGKT